MDLLQEGRCAGDGGSKPTAAFDAKWGNFVFNGSEFTKMVYAGLK
jgi:hypothetical protein